MRRNDVDKSHFWFFCFLCFLVFLSIAYSAYKNREYNEAVGQLNTEYEVFIDSVRSYNRQLDSAIIEMQKGIERMERLNKDIDKQIK